MKALIPGANKRLNELIGFLWLVTAVLVALSLASYAPLDPSLNTSTPLEDPAVQNWIGVVGAYLADILLQGLGAVAFLLPVLLAALAWKWFRSRAIGSPAARATGVLLLLLSASALLGLTTSLPRVFGLFPAGGLLGVLLAAGLKAILNVAGSYIAAVALLVVGAYLTTPFSLAAGGARVSQAFAGLRAPAWSLGGWLGAVRAWQGWRFFQRTPKPQIAPRLQPLRPAATAGPPRASQAVDISAPADLPEPGPARERKPSALPMHVPGLEEDDLPVPLNADDETAGKAWHQPAKSVPVARERYRLPTASLLHAPEHIAGPGETELQDRAETLRQKLEEFDVRGQVTQINPGPVVTTFEYRPEAGVKLSRITNLAEDLCLGLQAESILIERIPGKSTVGIEVPNVEREIIALREIIESQEFAASGSKLTISLGKDLAGQVRVADLTVMPHLLIAGATGTGKSVAINSMIISMLYKSRPDEVRFVLIDPKRLELGLYEGIPHLFTPIVTDPKKAANALRNATKEMDRRLKLLAHAGVRNLAQYNRLFEKGRPPADLRGEPAEPLPYIVIVIDELADLMLVDSLNVEASITRLAQMARAVGIHLILATQRPSVDVITGLIKANFPARISFR
ncbi:MAG: DNA translocase FtsK 4TM domain-containing protein, partial [Terriglobia bacterium]